MEEDYIVCRCEEITLKEIQEAIDRGARSIDEVKKHTRAGMGSCQGRICSTLITKILETRGFPPSLCPPPHSRPPVRCINIGEYVEELDNE